MSSARSSRRSPAPATSPRLTTTSTTTAASTPEPEPGDEWSPVPFIRRLALEARQLGGDPSLLEPHSDYMRRGLDPRTQPTRKEMVPMTAIYEFTCFLRIPAERAEEARERARALADAVSHGEATLALDDSEPSIDESDDEGFGAGHSWAESQEQRNGPPQARRPLPMLARLRRASGRGSPASGAGRARRQTWQRGSAVARSATRSAPRSAPPSAS